MKRLGEQEWQHVVLRNNEHKPCKRWGHRCLMIEHEMILFGGFDTNYMNDLWVFNTETLLWKFVATMGDQQPKRSNFSMCYDEVYDRYNSKLSRIVVYGGKLPDKKTCNAVWVLDWKPKEWWQLPCNSTILPEERKYHVAELFYPYMVMFGGESTTDLDDLWLHNMTNLTWKEVKPEGPKPRARRFHTSALVSGCLFIIGGCFNKYQPLGDVWMMNLEPLKRDKPQELIWKEITKTFSGNYLPRWGHTSTSKDDCIYVFGGKIAPTQKNDIYVINLSKKQIYGLNTKNEPSSRRRHTAVFVGASLIIFGGFNVEYFDDLFCLTLKEKHSNCVQFHMQKDMEELVNNSKFNCTVVTTADKYRLYIHPAIIRRKLGQFTEQFIDKISIMTSKEAVKALKRVYTQLDYFNKGTLAITTETDNNYLENLLQMIGATSSLNMPGGTKEGIIILNDSQWQNLEQVRSREYLDPTDELIIIDRSLTIKTSLTLIKARSLYFEHLFSLDFQETNTHTLQSVKPHIFQIVLKYIEFDYVFVSPKFGIFEWFELLMAAKYYCLKGLKIICERQILILLNQSNIKRIFELAVKHKIKSVSTECAQMIVLADALEQAEKIKPKTSLMNNAAQHQMHTIMNRTREQLRFYIAQILAEGEKDNPEKAAHD